MALLRPASVQQVLDELGNSRFGLVGFQVMFPDEGDTLVSITFGARISFRFQVSQASNGALNIRVSPGAFRVEDLIQVAGFSECVKQIPLWTRRIHEDLKVRTPALDDAKAFQQKLEEHVKGSVPDADKPFSDKEVKDLLEKLSALEARIGEMEEKHELTQAEVWQLRQAVSDAKADLPSLPKGVWYRTAGGKVWEVMKKAAGTTEGRQILAEAARRLLGMNGPG